MAQRVFSPSVVWPTKDVNTFIVKNLTLVPEQKKALESDLAQERFFKDYEKHPGYKASFEFKNKMVPLFKLGDVITKVKQEVDDTLDGCGAVVVPREHPSAGFTGWGQETVPALFKPLLCSPQINVREESPELFLDDLDHLDQATKDTIQERCKAKLDANKQHAEKALAFSQGLFGKVYEQLSRTANVTSDSIRMFLKLFSVTDANQRRLVKSKMASIFKPAFRRALLKSSQDSSEGIFGGKSNVLKTWRRTRSNQCY